MGSEAVRKKKSTADFWCAMRFITPYWRLMVVSIVCAFFCAAAATSGLGMLLPICNVLFKGDTVPTWAQREIAAQRMGVRFSDDVNELRIVKLTPGGEAARAGLQKFDVPESAGGRPEAAHGVAWRAIRSGPHHGDRARAQPRRCEPGLPPLPRYLVTARQVALRFPTHPVKAIALRAGRCSPAWRSWPTLSISFRSTFRTK